MNDIQLKIENNRGHIFVEEEGEHIADMEVGIVKGDFVIYHTEVSDKLAGKGVGRLLLQKAVEYAKENGMMIIPLCPFAYGQMKKNEAYKGLWKLPKNGV